MGKRYAKAVNDEWIQPITRGYKMACCDCGLVHELDFRVIKYANGTRTKVQFRARRNNRSTALFRRHNGIVLLGEPPHAAPR